MIVLTAEQAAAVDRRTIDELGVPGPVLMEVAGRAVVQVLLDRWQPLVGTVAVFCGPGNNGGDGFVCARALALREIPVEVVLLGAPDRLRGDAAVAFRLLREAGGADVPIHEIGADTDLEPVRRLAHGAVVVVDALFGTGLVRPLAHPASALVEVINACGKPVLAVDIPSGVNASTGALPGPAVRANVTVTMGFLKRGLLLYPGAAHCGEIRVAEIGFPPQVAREAGDGVNLVEPAQVSSWLPPRPAAAHKGSAGRIVLVAGSLGMTGAAILATRAALRTGGGLVVLALAQALNALVKPTLWEALTAPLPDEGRGWLADDALDAARIALQGADAVAIGPGLGRHPATLALVRGLLAEVAVPLVVDADALLAVPAASRASRATVVTPHPGEMSRLLDTSVADVLADPIAAARTCARRYDVVALLKGAHTVVAAPDGRVRINPTGNPGMASGGMGDVLTGVIATLLAQQVPPFEAAAVGAFVHGRAGDRVAAACGGDGRGMVAGDVAEALPWAISHLEGCGVGSSLPVMI